MTDDYSAFRKWYETLNWIMERTEKYPKDVRFSFTNRILSITVEVLERRYTPEIRQRTSRA
jgi:hypothetical protein